MRKIILLLLPIIVISCREKKVCPAGPYQIATIRIMGDSLIKNSGFIVKTYDLQNFTFPVDSLRFSSDNQGHLDYDLEISGQHNYIIHSDTLKIQDTISDVVETRDDCGNAILLLNFKLNGKLITNRTIHY
jgi:hypothetical protein